jgi:hypothetical protein
MLCITDLKAKYCSQEKTCNHVSTGHSQEEACVAQREDMPTNQKDIALQSYVNLAACIVQCSSSSPYLSILFWGFGLLVFLLVTDPFENLQVLSLPLLRSTQSMYWGWEVPLHFPYETPPLHSFAPPSLITPLL